MARRSSSAPSASRPRGCPGGRGTWRRRRRRPRRRSPRRSTSLGPGTTALLSSATHVAVYTALERGDRAAAGAALQAFDARSGSGQRIFTVATLGEARGWHALASDRPEDALRLATKVGEEHRAAGIDTPSIPWRAVAAFAALRLGDEARARELADEQLELARRWQAPTELGIALRVLARVDGERRLELLEESIATLEDSPARLELARALVDLGEALRVTRRRTEAREPLLRGAELATECRSKVLRVRARDALAALGDKPRKLMFSGPEGLTASERRVAQLAIDGRTNRDIAQELFVTPKTVENHLGRVYMKLGISSRRELAGSLE